ncbi:hypothetical protein E2C01_089258 [Portunus trituberculatus]|uniref:Uncharacterized protein n=1 Tax=Portunus trituberculatus TaxID=210409 RepID=A0A5B7JIM0_PORTR|nr:hypothetical protein [Portunus trituberculatus]
MTLGQSNPQLGGREGRKIYAERFHSLAVTCAWSCRMPLGNIGKVFREEVGDSPRVCHRSPSRQQNWWGKSKILPRNSPDFVKDIRKRSRLFVPLSKCGGPKLGSGEKLPDNAGPHDFAVDERKLPVSLSPLQCMLRSTKERSRDCLKRY